LVFFSEIISAVLGKNSRNLLSPFLELLVAPYVKELIPTSAIFSFASLFLFLAVLPLLLAPEPLPEEHACMA